MIYLLPSLIALLFLQTGGPSPDIEQMRHQASQAANKHREEALRLNDLAGHISTEADAETLVDAIAEMFADQLPPPWATREVRRRLARTEYAAATNPSGLIPEERLALIWNQYAREIGASDETIVSATELHSLRDLEYSTANLMWSRGWNQSIWPMPDVYALGLDGKVAGGCRALEALRVFYDLDNQFGNLRAARKALAQGISFADQIRGRNTGNTGTKHGDRRDVF
jgi:hypothetical protein